MQFLAQDAPETIWQRCPPGPTGGAYTASPDSLGVRSQVQEEGKREQRKRRGKGSFALTVVFKSRHLHSIPSVQQQKKLTTEHINYHLQRHVNNSNNADDNANDDTKLQQ